MARPSHDAGHIWGRIRINYLIVPEGNDLRMRAFWNGIAGENLVKFAAIMNDGIKEELRPDVD
jgi:aldehyde:ferredoxin oxidoreductase